jgi:hypothetical protein
VSLLLECRSHTRNKGAKRLHDDAHRRRPPRAAGRRRPDLAAAGAAGFAAAEDAVGAELAFVAWDRCWCARASELVREGGQKGGREEERKGWRNGWRK